LSTPLFEFIVAQGPEGSTVHLGGEIDLAATLELGPRLQEIARKCDSLLTFDLADVTFIDSEGIKLLLCVFDAVRENGGQARIAQISERARRVMNMAGVADILSVADPMGSIQRRQFAWRIPGPELTQRQ
jgi:anti-sigma B factor antagonist